MVTAPKIHANQVAYLKALIEQYIDSRFSLFPTIPLKPKHHFLLHYPELILHFGPLIRLWTLRFESKHTFFKQCARKLHNFKNLNSTLAERHQLLQAYLQAGNMDSVEDVIRKVLPMLQENDFNNLMTHLTGIGVQMGCDLQFVTLEDIKDIVPLIAARRLVHHFSNRDVLIHHTGHEDYTSGQLSNCPKGSSSSGQATQVPVQVSDWVSSYEVPWEKMPPNLRQCVAQGKRPRKQELLVMVRTIVDSIQKVCLNPSRSQCSEIARRIMEKYPKSFADVTMEGDLIGCGYGSLLNQIKTRVEHVNRDNTLVRVRKPKRINENESTPSSESTASKCAKTDSYGCINWHPVDLPEDETPESVEEKRKEMVKLFSQEGPRAAERGQVEEWMKTTYASQRYAINNNPPPSIDELKDQWPFLFMKRFLCAHFNTLTGIDVNTRFTESLNTKGKKVLHFFESQLSRWKKDVRTVLKDINQASKEDVDYGVASIITTMAYFKEKEDALFLLADVTFKIYFYGTMMVSVTGDSVFIAKKWMLTMEGRVIMEQPELTDFQSALAILFGCYYVFNVQYQEEAMNTLEFIQRLHCNHSLSCHLCGSILKSVRRTRVAVQLWKCRVTCLRHR
uniref:Uncharacterized protein n=1 Tax=Cyprinus carpio TaxID=7962 RepID=A0A8C2BC44_CYPCA